MRRSVATKPTPVASATSTAVAPPAETLRAGRSRDIRSAPYPLSRVLARAVIRRVASIACLVALDLCGLVLGLYAALALREAYHGNALLWGLLWDQLTNIF